MALSNQVMSKMSYVPSMQPNEHVLEKVVLEQDLSKLSATEKISYIGHLCKSLGLNPYTKPFEIMKFNGKEVPYARKDCTEQLRKLHNVSITKLDTKVIDASVYVVTACAKRGEVEDSSTGVISILGLKGEALANAMMKAETKAKRRVTLSICGLGFLDETEVDSIPNAKKIDVYETKELQNNTVDILSVAEMDEILLNISQCANEKELETVFKGAYKELVKAKDKDNLQRLISAKDKRKGELLVKEFNEEIVNAETGEVTS